MEIRRAMLSDADSICALNEEELGYSFSKKQTKEQLDKLLLREDHCILVSCIDEQVIGYVHAVSYELLYSEPMKDILGIAVSHKWQKQGTGKALLKGIEDWAKQDQCCGVRLVSGEKRIEAHRFYEREGYVNGKRQCNFKKFF